MVEQNPIKLFHTEEFKFEKVEAKDGKAETIIISGNAQPLNEDSRNGVRYRPESVKKAAKTLANVAFLFNHNSDLPIGHTIDSGLTDSHLTYKVDMDPEEKNYLRKVERGDIKHVSVGCMVENVEWNEEENIYICDVKEYVELSLVPVPGFSNTSANKESAMYLAESLGDEKVLEKLKTEKKEDAKSEEDTKENKEADDSDEDDTDKDKDESDDDSDDDDNEEADSDDDTDKEDEADDSDDSDNDSDEGSDSDDDEKDEKDDEDDKEEKLNIEKIKGEKLVNLTIEELTAIAKTINLEIKEDATKEEIIVALEKAIPELEESENEEETIEEKVDKLLSGMNELFSKFDEMNNRVSIIEANVDAINDSEEKQDIDSKELNPDKDEKFEDKHIPNQTKQNLEAKEKALFGEKTKKVSENSEVINSNKVRLSNISY